MKKAIAFSLYNPWPLIIPEIPPRSRLYHLPPQGIGTPYTESLTSYMARLALNHHLRPWQLYVSELVPLIQDYEYLLRRDTPKKSIKQTFLTQRATPSNLSVINGLKHISEVIVTAMEKLTQRDDLRWLTLVSWFNVIDYLESPLKKYCAWCPHCYQLWQQQGAVIYIPLLWLLKPVKFCPHHQILLRNQCPYCRNYMLNFCQPGYCSYCGKWLGQWQPQANLSAYFKSEEKLKAYQQQSFYLQNLIAITPSLSQPPTLKDLFVYLHHRCAHLNEAALKELSFSFWLTSPRIYNPELSYSFYKSRISLYFLYEVCSCLNTFPSEIFR